MEFARDKIDNENRKGLDELKVLQFDDPLKTID